MVESDCTPVACCCLSARHHRASDAGMASPASPSPAPAAKRATHGAKDMAAKVQVLKALQARASRKEVIASVLIVLAIIRTLG